MTSSRHALQVGARFSAAARTYDDVADLQRRVAACLLDLVPLAVQPRRVVDIGCGTGALTSLVCARWPTAFVDAIDLAPQMIDVARTRVGRQHRVSLHVADAADVRLAHPCDLLVSSSTLHWLRPFDAGIRHVARLVRPGGHFAVALMLEGTLRELHEARRRVAPATAPHARLPTFQETVQAVEDAGLLLVHSLVDQHEMAYPSARGLLHALRQLGATGGDLSHGPRPLTRKGLEALADEYARLHPTPDRGVRCTYVVGYFLATRR